MNKTKVLIAGIAGASLGTEILKCLKLAGHYEVYGCDISSLAFGHYINDFKKTFFIHEQTYIDSILEICLKNKIEYIVPGGESPMRLLSENIDLFYSNHIKFLGNNKKVIEICSSKSRLFEFLGKQSILIPKTEKIEDISEIKNFSFPCIVKPSKNSGGSNFVFLARDKKTLIKYCQELLENKLEPIVQEYISHTEGEFTIGVLSLLNKNIAGSLGLKRIFNSKLSVAYQSKNYLISSGYSQGLIDKFESICKTAENIAHILGSTGPINVQGRIKNGILIPFEINPRFSASTFLRAMAGFNEIDFYIQHLKYEKNEFNYTINTGYYFRTFKEIYVSKESDATTSISNLNRV